MKRTSDDDLTLISRQAMVDRGLLAEFSPKVKKEARDLKGPLHEDDGEIRDLRSLLWCSIDNDDSRDLDQLTVREKVSKDVYRIMVAVADVDSVVKKGTAIDLHAKHNTTTIYCPTVTFTMIPESLCYDVTSLNEGVDRLAIVIDMAVDLTSLCRALAALSQLMMAFPQVQEVDLNPVRVFPGSAGILGLYARVRVG